MAGSGCLGDGPPREPWVDVASGVLPLTGPPDPESKSELWVTLTARVAGEVWRWSEGPYVLPATSATAAITLREEATALAAERGLRGTVSVRVVETDGGATRLRAVLPPLVWAVEGEHVVFAELHETLRANPDHSTDL